MIQDIKEIEKWHNKKDPWGYENNEHDTKRKSYLLSEIPDIHFENVLDIGCGQGFITQELPGNNVFGVDISSLAIEKALEKQKEGLSFKQGSIFDIDKLFDYKFNLVIITGVLYDQYIGESEKLIYRLIDSILDDNGILISVHIDEWYKSQFPYLKTKQVYYPYREYTHKLEIYVK